MKKRLVIGASLVAVVLSVALCFISVFAAVGQEFGVNNKITFIGTDEYLVFRLDAKITGVVDEENYVFEGWDYDYEKNPEESKTWNLGELRFKEEGVSEFVITYDFTIINKSKGKMLVGYIEPPEIDQNVLSYEIISSDENLNGVALGGTLNLSLKVKAKSVFAESRTCNFRIIVETTN